MPYLNVLVTIDTEVWPRTRNWREKCLVDDIKRDIDGRTEQGAYGIGYQMDVLDKYRLKGVFFVEALFACFAGLAPLRNIISQIQERGHEVQLHIHPEWLGWMPKPLLGERRGRNLADFLEEEQHILLRQALANLREAGARNVNAFRAGNYGADNATLRALHRLGIRYDTSYNYCYLDRDCRLALPERLLQPKEVEGVCEVPVSFFSDFPGHHRHAQLCACSYGEMRQALLQARELGWQTFVIVSHSFELIRRDTRETMHDPVILQRFGKLCSFLAENQNIFRTVGFNDLSLEQRLLADSEVPISRLSLTAMRMSEQLARRLRL